MASEYENRLDALQTAVVDVLDCPEVPTEHRVWFMAARLRLSVMRSDVDRIRRRVASLSAERECNRGTYLD